MEGASELSPEKQILLKRRLKRASQKKGESGVISRRPADQGGQLSFAQQQMWLIDRLDPGISAYNLPIGYRLKGSLDKTALEKGFNEIVKRHESLRSTFVLRDGHPAQVIHPECKVKVIVTKLDHLGSDERERRMQELASEESIRPFDLSRLPLLRVSLYKLGKNEHVLIINVHHIVADGLSSSVLLSELNTFYRIFTGEPVSRPPDLEIQYSDFAAWQTATGQKETLARQLDYWKNRLGGRLPVSELPRDKARPPLQSFQGSNVFFSIPAALAEDLVSLGQREGCTPFATMLAAFQVLLHRYSGAEDIVVGTPIADKSVKEVEPLIGNFVNMVALRCDLSGNPTFTEVLRRSRETTLDAFSNKDVPFARVVESLKFERDPGRNPIFQVVLQVMPAIEAKLEDLEMSAFQFDTKFAQFDLSLHLFGEGGGYRGQIEYCTDLFNADTVERLSRSFMELLRGIVQDPQQRITEIPLLTEAERNEILFEWNRPGVAYPKQLTLHEWFESQIKKSPTSRALTFQGRHLTYDELNRRANQVAHFLKGLGVGPDTPVGLCLDRSLEMVVGILGILKAGGAYLPIDPTAPKDRIAFMLEDANAPVLLTQAALAAEIKPGKRRVFCFDTDKALLDREPDADLPRNSSPDNLAYVIYTSGSTGKPKGTLVTHYNVVRLMQATEPWYRFDAQDVWTFFHSHAFDFSVWEMWGALLYGGRLVMVPYLISRSPEEFYRLLATERITILNQTPSAFSQLMQAEETLGISEALALRWVIFGGEALEMHSLKPWFDRHGDQRPRLVNMYGITETTVHVTYRPLSAADLESNSVVGVPIPDLQTYILDPHQQPVPIGVTGEIYIGGAGVARGYLNRKELTRERFLPDPFRPSPAALLYRSGDLGRYLPNRDIEYLGRIDHQVKIRGFRVELGEIETLLNRHEAVRQCVVMAQADATGEKTLVAYFEPRDGLNPAVSELRAHLKKDLPAYMVPSAFVSMERLPLTPNGKIDRSALPAPTEGSLQSALAADGPRTETEKALAAIWTEVLKIENVGVNDDFFDLGGHSLLVIKAVSRIRTVFNLDLSPRTFFVNPTISGLAKALDGAKGGGQGTQRIERRTQRGPCPLSFAQERLWFMDQLAPGSPVYNTVDVVRFFGRDTEAIKRAVNELVRRHEVLRTAVSYDDGEAMQIVFPSVDLAIPELDLSAVPEQERESEWLRVAREDGRRPFVLSRPPLLRATLIHLSDQEHLLLLTIHHIIVDEWSMEIIHRELQQLYTTFSRGQPSPLPELPIQYADFACWQRDRSQREMLERQTSYWKEELAGAPAILELPTDKVRPALQSFRGATEIFDLPKELLESLRSLGREEQATLFMTLVAGFMALLHRYTGQDDVLIGTPISGRTRSETENLIGFFVNNIVLRARFADDLNFRSLLQQVREKALGAYTHQDLSFGQLVAELAPERDPSHTPLFQVMFVLQNPEAASQASSAAGARQLETGTSKFDLTLFLSETSSGLDGLIEYSTDLFEAETVRRFFEHYRTLLETMARHPDQSISSVAMLADADRQKLLVDWNGTAVAFPEKDRCLHEIIAEQAKRTPDQVALVCGQEQLTYHELDRRANQLAHYLKSAGVGPDVLAGVCVERSTEMVVALLGILKAGAAYVPLDPSFPQNRLAHMVEDSGMHVLVTHRNLENILPVRPADVVRLDADWQEIAKQPGDSVSLPAANPRSLAYVLYTSGSTGEPKGVEVAHSALTNLLLSMRREPGFTAEDTLFAVTTLSFDIAGLEIYLPLISGGRVVIASSEDARDPARLMDLMAQCNCNVMQATPATWQTLIDAGWRGSSNLKILCGGEALRPDLAQELLPRCAELWNMYGPTETTIWSTIHRVVSADRIVPIGRPIANTQVVLLDKHLNLVPERAVGELYIGGAGLARGYWHRPDLTRERFIRSPFDPKARLYRTGDLARWLPDGTLECLGRVDNQVKIRGFRIELGEIETILGRHEAVRQCVVVSRDDHAGQLVAYFTPQTGSAPELAALRTYLKKELPDYMIPSAFVSMEQLPMTPNGKIDRKALPAADGADQIEGEFVAPRDEIEQALARLWGEVLKARRVGVHDNFFELGGHSLLAVRIIFEIEKLFGRRLPLATLLRAPTIAHLADELRKEGGPATQRIPPRQPGEAIPLSYAQEQIWLHTQLAAEAPLYNEPLTICYTGSLDAGALERSFNEILRRHEAWRTTIATVDGEPRQIVQPEITISLPVEDLRGLPKEQREAEALRRATEDAKTSLDLTQAPLFRTRLIQIDDEEYRLYLTLSHIIFDGVAIYQVFLPELAKLYEAFSAGQPSPLPELSIQYPDYACWQRRSLTEDALKKDIAYWRRQLGRELPALYLPADRLHPGPQSFRGSQYGFELHNSLTTALRKISHEEGVSMFHVLLAGFAALLRHYSGEEVIPIGSITAGRNWPETQSLLGCFLTTVVLAVDLSGDPTFRDLVERTRTITIEALEHDSLPFGHVVNELHVRRDPSHNPLFQALLTLGPLLPELNPAWRLRQTNLETGFTKYDFHLELDERADAVLATLYYSTDLFDLETIKRMVGHWQTLLEGAARDPGARISELPVLSESERRELAARNETRCEYPRDRCIHQLFFAQSELTPDAIAVRFGETHLSFGELQERSSRLANHLQKLGVGPGALVGLCVERSLDMMVGLLGILKAGGAYVPLDPSYPSERLAFMLEDSRVAVLLTQQELVNTLPPHQARQVCLDADWEKIAAESAKEPLSAIGPEDPAYVIYTSGSTGKPKGVVGTHRAAVNRFAWMWQTYPFQAGEVCCQKTSLSFVDSVWEVFGPLLKGVPIVIIPDAAVRDVSLLIETLATNHVTRIVLVPSLLRAILGSSDNLREKLPELKLWVSSGEALPLDLAQSFLDGMPGHTLLNLYGSTEVAADATYYEVGTNGTMPSVPIGRPIANTRVYLLDAYRHPVPANVPGEIYIGGDAVAQGYLNRPEMTAEKFIPDLFTNEPGARLFKTGDQGRYHADGNIECLGRLDHQVKIRGFRIELGEVEAVLNRHEAVRQGVVVVREDTPGDKRLVAYFEAHSWLEPTVSDLRAYLGTQLPEYMLPSAFVALKTLPVNPNGKIDRKSLPAPEGTGQIQGTFVAPRDEIEQVLAQLWVKVLKTGHVEVQDNFFDLGGHSLLAVRIMFEIEKLFGRRLPLATLLQAPTIGSLADVLRKENWKPNWSSLVSIRPGGSKRPLFLMHSHGGNVLEYYPLASHMESDQPVYALQSRGLDGQIARDQSLETMAALYLKELRSLQPAGPYSLGGFCFGGLLALEAARQLRAAGEEVALVILIQTMNPTFARFKPSTPLFQQWWYRTTKRIDLERDNFSYRGARYVFDRFRDVVDIARARTSIALDHAIRNGHYRRPRPSLRYVLESLAIEHEKALRRYVLRPYSGDIVVFRASKTLGGLMIDDSLGWKQVIQGNLEVCEIPGHQQNMLSEPKVSRLAEELSVRLTESHRGSFAGSSRLISSQNI